MKKAKLMMGVLIASMALLGTGYAAWSETLTVESTVNTGKLDIEILGQREDGGTIFYQEAPGASNLLTDEELAQYLTIRKTTGHVSDKKNNFSINIKELAPGVTIGVPIEIKNVGSCAAALTDIEAALTTANGELRDNLQVLVKYVSKDKEHYYTEGFFDKSYTNDETYAMAPGEEGQIQVFIGLNSEANNRSQNVTDAKVDIDLTFSQSFAE